MYLAKTFLLTGTLAAAMLASPPAAAELNRIPEPTPLAKNIPILRACTGARVAVATDDGRVSQLTPTVRVVTAGESLSGAVASFTGATIELLPGDHTLDADIAGNTVTLRFRRCAVLLVPVSSLKAASHSLK